MKHFGDITKIRGYEVPAVDCVIGGSPCQDLSVAGKRAGLAGERSELFMDQIRIIKEMRENERKHGRPARPRFMVWENVPGAFSSNKGEDFGTVLQETIKVICPQAPPVPIPKYGWPTSGCLTDVGGKWSLAWRVFDAQFWGVPQRRRRIALVADFGGLAAPEVLFVRKGMCGDIEEGGEAGEETAGGTGGGTYPTAAKPLKAKMNLPFQKERDNLILQHEPATTLRIRCGCEGGGKGAVAVFENHGQDSRVKGPLETCPTITQRWETGGGNTALVVAAGQGGAEIISGLSPTLNCNHEQPIVAGIDCRHGVEIPELSGTLLAKANGGQSLNSTHPVRIGYTVRRLTPLECERLQGFPDGWTDIGPWTDGKGKLHKESSDSTRYKALGNSIAIPPWKWVIKRLCACYERDAAMASLFDGIGGFPYIWEQLNGKGSCIWASEIDEFPIAVTKYHF